jgi:hypothetical protein
MFLIFGCTAIDRQVCDDDDEKVPTDVCVVFPNIVSQFDPSPFSKDGKAFYTLVVSNKMSFVCVLVSANSFPIG